MNATSPQIEPPKPAPAPRSLRKWWIVLGALVIVIAIFAFGVYRWGWNGPVTRVITNIVPYPAAIVDGSVIRWSDFQENLAVLEHFYTYEKDKGLTAQGSIFPSDDDLKQRVLDRLILDRLAENLAAREHIVVGNADIETAYGRLAVQGTGTDSSRAAAELQVQDALGKMYGLSPSQTKDLVIRPIVIRQKLQIQLDQDDAVNASKKQKADEAAAALKAGKDFKETVLAYSEDPNVSVSFGDHGMLGSGFMPAEVDSAIAQAQTGDILGPIKSVLGWHVIKVGDIKMEGGLRKVGVQEIIIYPMKLDDWLAAQRKSASVVIFVH